mmetsp:Transcript_52569/g.104314  ORF Transcript_52569/g.104314 Transcript_52569/m.104314 type:complete len:263 (+) Transcript_52569:255-1043(+)
MPQRYSASCSQFPTSHTCAKSIILMRTDSRNSCRLSGAARDASNPIRSELLQNLMPLLSATALLNEESWYKSSRIKWHRREPQAEPSSASSSSSSSPSLFLLSKNVANASTMRSADTLCPQYLSSKCNFPESASKHCMPQILKPTTLDDNLLAFVAIWRRLASSYFAERCLQPILMSIKHGLEARLPRSSRTMYFRQLWQLHFSIHDAALISKQGVSSTPTADCLFMATDRALSTMLLTCSCCSVVVPKKRGMKGRSATHRF